jgi:CheY-like chemotaxis protein/anti-sigma regulatory factor (Ser/Thr protein kinase)
MTPAAAARGITIALPATDGSEHWFVTADHHRLKQVLLNLVSNAVKYNRQDGHVKVTLATAAADAVRVTITDTGRGMQPEELRRIFVPFDRLNAAQSGIEGTGLGLTIAKGLILHMRGDIGVRSTPGVGTSFWLDLPRAEAPIPVAMPTSFDPDAPVVLQIDGNADDTTLVERLLGERPELTLVTAMQGRLGVDLARDHRPALILLDLRLPDLHGFDVLRALVSDPRTAQTPVVVVTADATPTQRRQALALGARDVLHKPLDVSRFFETLDRLVPASLESSWPPV